MIFVKGLDSPEGPVALPDGSWLAVEMGPERGCVSRISPDGRSIQVLAKTGRPNGLAVDRHGIIWVAESKTPALLKMTPDGSFNVFLTKCDELPMLFPNDLCFGPDGLLYLTDSGILIDEFAPGGKIREDYAALHFDGRIYQINTLSRRVQIIDRGIRFTNGIVIGLDQNLYVNETLTGNVYRYNLDKGKVGPRQLFGNVIDPAAPPGYKGPDGMKFDLAGNLYVTVYGQQDVTVLDPAGRVTRRIRTHGKKPTNLAFGLAGDPKIYVTEVEFGHLESHDVGICGLPLYQ